MDNTLDDIQDPDQTSASLLARLQQPRQQAAWARFVDLYTPLIYYWARHVGLPSEEAEDLVQDVLAVLIEKLPVFQYDPSKSFRGWLRTVTLNKWRENHRRRASVTAATGVAMEALAESEATDSFWETEYRQHIVSRALKLMQAEFQASTWKACWEVVVGARPAAEVAEELGISIGAVRAAKFRVLSRLRQELEGLLD